jgi:KRAB domain-containing zinc finger protein
LSLDLTLIFILPSAFACRPRRSQTKQRHDKSNSSTARSNKVKERSGFRVCSNPFHLKIRRHCLKRVRWFRNQWMCDGCRHRTYKALKLNIECAAVKNESPPEPTESSSSSDSDDEVPDNPKDKSFLPDYSCKYCDKSFFFKNEHDQHMKNEHVDKLTCTICNKLLTSESQMELHKKKHEKMEKLQELTRLTGKVYKDLPRHKKKQCNICMQFVWDVETHVRVKHTHERPFQCTHCAMSFAKQSHLKVHIDRKHELKYIGVCRFCGKGCFSNAELQVHERTHTGEKTYICEQCGKSFYTKSSLQSHAVVHIETANFECDTCKKKFKTNSALREHQKCHLERQFKCHLCGKEYIKKSTLKNHINTHSNVKPYQCDVCGSEYYTRLQLIYHMNKKHIHPKSNICEICGRGYQSKGGLLRHIETAHRDSGLYVNCDICGKLYANYNSLIDHKLKSHSADCGIGVSQLATTT